jgi:hypothetical protein
VEQLGQLRDIGDRGMGRAYGVDNTALIGPDVQLHPEVPVPALARLFHLGVARRAGVFGRTGRRDDGRIDDGPRAQQKAARLAQASNRVKDGRGQAVLFQQMANSRMLVSSGTASSPNSTHAKRRIESKLARNRLVLP